MYVYTIHAILGEGRGRGRGRGSFDSWGAPSISGGGSFDFWGLLRFLGAPSIPGGSFDSWGLLRFLGAPSIPGGSFDSWGLLRVVYKTAGFVHISDNIFRTSFFRCRIFPLLMGEPMQVDEVGSSSEQRPHLTAHHKLRERLRIAHLPVQMDVVSSTSNTENDNYVTPLIDHLLSVCLHFKNGYIDNNEWHRQMLNIINLRQNQEHRDRAYYHWMVRTAVEQAQLPTRCNCDFCLRCRY